MLAPREIESMALAGVELEALTVSIADRLREAGISILPSAMRTCGSAIGSDLWRMEWRKCVRRERRTARVEKNSARLKALLDESLARLPSLSSHHRVGHELCGHILSELERLRPATFPRPRR